MNRNRVLLGASLLLLTAVAYEPALRGGFVWDDNDYVTDNRALRSSAGLLRIWFDTAASPQYYPLVFSSFWLEYHLWGDKPAGYHIVNVLLHGCNAVLFWMVLRRLAVPGAWLAAALFALHPVHVESVAWVQERKNVLSGAFYLAAILAYLRFAPAEENASPSRTGRWKWYLLALALFLAALLSKTATCTLPPALLVLFWWRRGRITRWDILWTLPFFALAVGFGLLTMWVERHQVGTRGADWVLTPTDRSLIAGRALWFYLAKLGWPWELIFIYPRWRVDAGLLWQYLFPTAALATILVLWILRYRIGRGPLAAFLFFAGTLAPTLGFFDVYFMHFSFVADHFQYLASMGILALAAAAMARLLAPLDRRQWGLRLTSGLVLLLLGMLTWRQAHAYQSSQVMWTQTLARNPECWLARHNLGKLYLQQGQTASAERELAEAVRLRPGDALFRVSWGNALMAQNRFEEAARQFSAAVDLDPGLALAHLNLGVALMGLERTPEAADAFLAATQADPSHALAFYYLGLARVRQEQFDNAAAAFDEATRLSPGFAEAHFQAGDLQARRRQWAAAIVSYRRAVALKPQFIPFRHELAQALQENGQHEEAQAQRFEILRLNMPQGRGGPFGP